MAPIHLTLAPEHMCTCLPTWPERTRHVPKEGSHVHLGSFPQIKPFGASRVVNLCYSKPGILVKTFVSVQKARKLLYVFGRNFYFLLLNFAFWPCLGPA